MLTVINIFNLEIGKQKMQLSGKASVAILVMRGNLMLPGVNKIEGIQIKNAASGLWDDIFSSFALLGKKIKKTEQFWLVDCIMYRQPVS